MPRLRKEIIASQYTAPIEKRGRENVVVPTTRAVKPTESALTLLPAASDKPQPFGGHPSFEPGNTHNRKSKEPHRLTEREQLFVHNYANLGLTKTASARIAGYSSPGPTAIELLARPKIREAVEREREQYRQTSGMTKAKVIEGFKEAIDMGRIKADPMSMISGWREIGRMCGFYEPSKAEVKISVEGQVLVQRLNSMSDEELLALAEGDPSILEGDFHVIEPGTDDSDSSEEAGELYSTELKEEAGNAEDPG